jgi:hypothetical protein
MKTLLHFRKWYAACELTVFGVLLMHCLNCGLLNPKTNTTAIEADTTCGGYGCNKGRGEITPLGYDFARAYYSKELNKFLFVSADSQDLLVYNVDSRATSTLQFDRSIHYVTISPDGKRAAVNVPGKLFYLDIANDSLLSQTYLPVLPGPIALLHDNFVLATASTQSLACIINPVTGEYFYSHQLFSGFLDVVLHPNQNKVYSRDWAKSDAVAVFGVTDSTVDILDYLPLRYSEPNDNRIWLFNEANRMITQAGELYGTENSDSLVFTLPTHLPIVSCLASFSQSSSSGIFAVVPCAPPYSTNCTPGSERIFIFNEHTLSCVDTILLPLISDTIKNNPAHPNLVLYSRATSQYASFGPNSSDLYIVADLCNGKAIVKVRL